MGNENSAERFQNGTVVFSIYYLFALFGVTTLGSLHGIYLMQLSQGWRNYTLLALLLMIFGQAVGYLLMNYWWNLKYDWKPVPILTALILVFDLEIHWLISKTYLKVAFDTKQLLDPDVYFKNEKKMSGIDRFRWRLKVANVLVHLTAIGIFLSILLSLLQIAPFWVYQLGNYTELALLTLFAGLWGWTLASLYRNVKNSRKLLPDKRVFKLHGGLLVFYLLFMTANIVCIACYFRTTGST